MSFWRTLLVKLFGSSATAVATPGTAQEKEAAIVQAAVEAGLEAAAHGIERATEPKVEHIKTPEEKAAAQKAKADKKAAKVSK